MGGMGSSLDLLPAPHPRGVFWEWDRVLCIDDEPTARWSRKSSSEDTWGRADWQRRNAASEGAARGSSRVVVVAVALALGVA